jgi:hypothetical protein
MRRYHNLIILVTAVLLLTGCPWQKYRFTSADLAARNTRGGLLLEGGALAADMGEETEDDTGAQEAAVREVIEPDVIRRDGNILYVLNQYRGLTIVDLERNRLLGQVATFGFPRDLYLKDGRAYVLVGYASSFSAEGASVAFEMGSKLYVVDVSDPSDAAIRTSFAMQGDLADSRQVGDVIYAVSARYEWTLNEEVEAAAVEKKQTSASWVTSINIADTADIHAADSLSFAGYGDIIQATPAYIFAAAPDWASDSTAITIIDISDPAGAIRKRGSITVAGYVNDRFKMDAWRGVLRVISGNAWQERSVHVSTVSLADPDNPSVLGEITVEDAADEQLFATRFDGPRAYIVTYFIVDPLFVVDLSEPENPKVEGELKVPGWSTHIEPRGDRLIALGVDDTDGQRVSVSIFDVANPAAPALLDRASFGSDWSWSSAYDDVKAFTVLDDLLIVPFSGWDEAGGYDRLEFIRYTADTLEPLGHADVSGYIQRSFEYGGGWYGVTSMELARIQLGSGGKPVVTDTLPLADNVVDLIELPPDCAVEVVSRPDAGQVLLRPMTPDGAYLSDGILVNAGAFLGAYPLEKNIILVSEEWDETDHHYQVVYTSFTDPARPELRNRIICDVAPWQGWDFSPEEYAPLYHPETAAASEEAGAAEEGAAVSAGAAEVKQEADVIAPMAPMPYRPLYTNAAEPLRAGDILALRCRMPAEGAITIGNAPAKQALALFDLKSRQWRNTVGLGYRDIQTIDAAGDHLYIGTKESFGGFLWIKSRCAFFLRQFDPVTLQAGPAVNVPGIYKQYDPETDRLLLEEVQYTETGTDSRLPPIIRSLESLAWDGASQALPADSLVFESGTGSVLPRGDAVYYNAWQEDGALIGRHLLTEDGLFEEGGALKVPDTFSYLIDAHGDETWSMHGGNLLVRCAFDGEPRIADLYEVMAPPGRLRYGSNAIWGIMGYAGLIMMPHGE